MFKLPLKIDIGSYFFRNMENLMLSPIINTNQLRSSGRLIEKGKNKNEPQHKTLDPLALIRILWFE